MISVRLVRQDSRRNQTCRLDVYLECKRRIELHSAIVRGSWHSSSHYDKTGIKRALDGVIVVFRLYCDGHAVLSSGWVVALWSGAPGDPSRAGASPGS